MAYWGKEKCIKWSSWLKGKKIKIKYGCTFTLYLVFTKFTGEIKNKFKS